MATQKINKIAIGSDHGGFLLKEILKKFLEDKGYQITDCGPDNTDPVNYPEFAAKVAAMVSNGKTEAGIMVDGAGIGSSMVANKIDGVRAALCYDVTTAVNAREHNNANLLTLGAGLTGAELAKQITETFMTHECTVDRHLKRVAMIDALDKNRTPINQPVSGANAVEEDNLADITEKDIDQIAEKVRSMISSENKPLEIKQVEIAETDMICKCGVHVERQPETLRKFIEFGVERLGYNNATGADCVPGDIAACIDHTLLKPDATADDIKKLCAEAKEYKFAAVCISPSYVALAAQELRGTDVIVCTVVGFPSGAHVPEIKGMETRRAIRDGAKEIDMVIDIGALKSGNDDLVYRDIRTVCEACEDGGAHSKVIIEAALLTDDEKVRACQLSKRARADFVKTSTGFGPHGATAADVELMSSIVQSSGIGVKAAGGIRSLEDATAMISAGATRIGASAGIKILKAASRVTVSS